MDRPRRVVVTFEVTVEMTVEAEAIDRTQTQEWREQMYDFTPMEAAAHLAWNLGVADRNLSDMDGWADMPNAAAEVTMRRHLEEVEIPSDGADNKPGPFTEDYKRARGAISWPPGPLPEEVIRQQRDERNNDSREQRDG